MKKSRSELLIYYFILIAISIISLYIFITNYANTIDNLQLDKNAIEKHVNEIKPNKISLKAIEIEQYSNIKDKKKYHFTIGSGKNIQKGKLILTDKWFEDIPNTSIIKIGLEGDFDKEKIHKRQFNTLMKLINALIEKYKIKKENIFLNFSKGDNYRLGKYFPKNTFFKGIKQ